MPCREHPFTLKFKSVSGVTMLFEFVPNQIDRNAFEGKQKRKWTTFLPVIIAHEPIATIDIPCMATVTKHFGKLPQELPVKQRPLFPSIGVQ